MSQNGMNVKGRRRETRRTRNTHRAKGLMNGQVPGTGLVNGAVVQSGFPAAATRTSEISPTGTPNGTKPQCMVNGYINHGYKGKSRKASPPGTIGKQRSTISAVTDTSAAGKVSSEDTPGGILVDGATSLDTLPSSDQMAPEPSLSAAAKNHTRRRRKFRHKKRDTDLACPENPIPLPMPPQEEEDWEVTATNWEKMCFGVKPYGPEDVLQLSLQDLTLQQRDSVDPPMTDNYCPSIHHPRPLQWSCIDSFIPTEPDQFADAD